MGFLLIYFNAPVSWVSALTFTGFRAQLGQLVFVEQGAQYWRFITPIFLHFGWLHITFNSLWMWELGGLIEQRLGSALLLALVVLTAAGSNYAQFAYTGPSLFGGMSGVVYALLGFCWVYNWLVPARGLALPVPIVVFMVVWLLFCMVAPTELLGIGSIANAAHAGGLMVGGLLALPVGFYHRPARRP